MSERARARRRPPFHGGWLPEDEHGFPPRLPPLGDNRHGHRDSALPRPLCVVPRTGRATHDPRRCANAAAAAPVVPRERSATLLRLHLHGSRIVVPSYRTLGCLLFPKSQSCP